MDLIIYKDIPCPVLSMKEPDTFLILFKGQQKWIFKCSLGYGEIEKDEYVKYHLFNGKLHREDGPAKEYVNGDKEWFINGKFHRENGPAVEWYDGEKHWYKNGKLHRLDGPAVQWGNKKGWFIENLEYSEEGYNKKIKEMKRDGTYSLRVNKNGFSSVPLDLEKL